MSKQVLIIGANSDIALASAQEFLTRGARLTLVAHKPTELPAIDAEIIEADLTNSEDVVQKLSGLQPDIVVYAAGKMVANEDAISSEAGKTVVDVNFTAAVRILGVFAEQFKQRKSGVIVGISSVAADRGKSSTVVYGAAKAGFDSFLAGLRQYLHPYNVRVVTIRPGYVDTKMTAGMNLPKRLTAGKEQVGKVIVKNALSGSRNIVYVLPVWRPIMWCLRQIPEFIFKRKSL